MKNLIVILITGLFVLGLSNGAHAKTYSNKNKTVQQSISQTVNLNKADAKEIAKILKGIGLKKAQSIVAYRKKHGDFKAVEEVASVKGIGVKTIAKNFKRIVLK